MLPTDPIILLSYVNTKLRDEFQSLEDFCKSLDIKEETLIETLDKLDYHYSKERSQFL